MDTVTEQANPSQEIKTTTPDKTPKVGPVNKLAGLMSRFIQRKEAQVSSDPDEVVEEIATGDFINEVSAQEDIVDLTEGELTPEVSASAQAFKFAMELVKAAGSSELFKFAAILGISTALNFSGIPHIEQVTTAIGFSMVGKMLGETPGQQLRNGALLGLAGVGVAPLGEVASHVHGLGEATNAVRGVGEALTSKPADIAFGLVDDLGAGAELAKHGAKKAIKFAGSRMAVKPKLEKISNVAIPEGQPA
ncbi:MAG TPA: hypothetical protein VHE53_04995 [Patescibacteria group bacterium]|nr:hypothetical protein [Patescibacteria group bacterium]